MKNKNLKYWCLIVVLIVILAVYFLQKNKLDNTNDMISTNFESNLTLTDELLAQIGELNKDLDSYYANEWQNEKFLSIASYFSKSDNTLVTMEDIEKFTGKAVPKELKNAAFHFVTPSSLLEFFKDGILEEDLNIITVFSAVPLKNGIHISSMYDEGGILSKEQYKQFVLNQYFEHGQIINPAKDTKDYNGIINAAKESDPNIANGNIKHIAHDEKYAALVISSPENPGYIKEFALENNDGKYKVISNSLEQSPDDKITINYAYNDFNLALLPIYNIASFKIINHSDSYLNLIKEKGFLVDEEITYFSGAGNFVYFESSTGSKILGYLKNGGQELVVYEIKDYKEAISLMVKLEENPPVFILKFE